MITDMRLKLFIVTWVNINPERPRYSEITTIGIFSTRKEAEDVISNHDRNDCYTDNPGCNYYSITETYLNQNYFDNPEFFSTEDGI